MEWAMGMYPSPTLIHIDTTNEDRLRHRPRLVVC